MVISDELVGLSLASLSFLSREILLAAAAFSFMVLFHYKTRRRRSAVPVNWPILRMLPGLLANLGNLHGWITDILHETACSFEFQGPRFLGMDFLITCDPANVNHVFNANFSNYPKGQEFSESFDILGDGIFNSDYELWKSQRKRAHSVMSKPDFRAFVATSSRDKVEKSLIPFLSQLADRGTVVDLQDVFMRLTFDMTCNLAFGTDPGSLSEELPIVPFARAMDDAMEAIVLRELLPPVWWKLMRWVRAGKEKKLHDATEVIDQFSIQHIKKKKAADQPTNHKQDLLSSYIQDIKESGEENMMEDKFLRDTVVNFMLAGRDTTGVAFTWFFWLLDKNPEVKSKIIEELREQILREKEDAHSFPVLFNPDELAKLVYLHASLSETLRLFPPVPFEHKTPVQDDVLPSGNRVKSKGKILFSAFSMGRMEGIWGKDCLEFKPERWISEQGRVRHEPSYKFFSFNCGPRTCLGKDIAFTQLKVVVAAMLYNFDVELVEGHVVEPKLSVILQMKNGLMVRIKRRQFAVWNNSE